MNRIRAAIDALEADLAQLDEAERARMHEGAMLPGDILLALGDRATLAYAEGRITIDEANTLHGIHSTFARATIAERVIFMQVMLEVRR